MKKYELTDEQIRNLKIFLQRTNLSGEEVPAFNQISSILNQPIKDPSPEQIMKEISSSMLIEELQSRDDWDVDSLISCDNQPDNEEIEEEVVEPDVKKSYKVKKSSLMKNRK